MKHVSFRSPYQLAGFGTKHVRIRILSLKNPTESALFLNQWGGRMIYTTFRISSNTMPLLNVSDSHGYMTELLEAVVLHFDIARVAVSEL